MEGNCEISTIRAIHIAALNNLYTIGGNCNINNEAPSAITLPDQCMYRHVKFDHVGFLVI